MSNFIDKNLNIEEYKTLSPQDRARFLHPKVEYGETLNENFFLEALRWEKDNVAKWYLIKGLGNIKSAEAIGLIIDICKQPEVVIRTPGTTLHTICSRSLGKIGSSALNDVLSLLEYPDVEVRRTAIDSLGEIGDEKAIDVLCDALKNELENIREWAALSLSKLGKVSIPCLSGIVLDQNNVEGSVFALDALLRIDEDSVFPIIEKVIETGTQEQLIYLLENLDTWYTNYFSVKTLSNTLSEDQMAALLLSKIKEKIN